MSYQTLKTAADTIDALAAELEAAQAQVKVAEAKAAEAAAKVTEAETKLAAAEEQRVQLAKTAAAKDEEVKAKRAVLAKTAADKLLDKGLLSSSEKRDQFATELLGHDAALEKIAKLAEFVQVGRVGTVVPDTAAKTASAEDTWARHVQFASAKLGIR